MRLLHLEQLYVLLVKLQRISAVLLVLSQVFPSFLHLPHWKGQSSH